MTFPFTSLVETNREAGLVVAVVLGFLFGFVLERAGFGRAPKLAAQFYFRDMTVFKVMFGAIVTAMLGLVLAASFGLVDLRSVSESIASWTYLWPMLAGGLLLGVGFIVSGYCPGTSIVAAASGNFDGLMTIVGVVIGTFLYSELLQIRAFAAFHVSGEKGALFLYDLLPVPAAVIAVAIALVAIGGFIGAEKVERLIAADEHDAAPPHRSVRNRVFATIGILAGLALGTMMVPSSRATAAQPPVATISARDLAQRLVDAPWTLRIVDVRPESDFAKERIPNSENVKADALADAGLQYTPPSKQIVIVGALAPPDAPGALHLPNVRVLRGGFAAWKQFAIDPPAPPAAGSPAPQMEAYLFRSAVHQALTGQKAAPPAAGAPHGVIAKPKKKGGGCSA